MPSQLGDAADVDERRRRRQPQLQQRNQAVAAGEQLRARMRRSSCCASASERGAVVVEVGAEYIAHAPFSSACIARHTRSGVSGIWIDSTPNGSSASITAL